MAEIKYHRLGKLYERRVSSAHCWFKGLRLVRLFLQVQSSSVARARATVARAGPG